MHLTSVRELKKRIRLGESVTALANVSGVKTAGMRAGNYFPNPRDMAVALGVAAYGDQYRLAVRVLRRSNLAKQYVATLHRLARGEIDVQYVGPISAPRPLNVGVFAGRTRPLLPGCSIGHPAVTAGTLGAFVQDQSYTYMLSNNHILAATNSGVPGDPTMQPGRADGGRLPRDEVGWLDRFVPLRVTGNEVDAAISSIWSKTHFAVQHGGKAFQGERRAPLDAGDKVWKIGRTTGPTTGIVTAVELDDVVVNYGSVACSFDNQIEIVGVSGRFSAGGDSGSLILDDRNRGAALLFAGSSSGATYANPIRPVLRSLGVTLLR